MTNIKEEEALETVKNVENKSISNKIIKTSIINPLVNIKEIQTKSNQYNKQGGASCEITPTYAKLACEIIGKYDLDEMKKLVTASTSARLKDGDKIHFAKQVLFPRQKLREYIKDKDISIVRTTNNSKIKVIIDRKSLLEILNISSEIVKIKNVHAFFKLLNKQHKAHNILQYTTLAHHYYDSTIVLDNFINGKSEIILLKENGWRALTKNVVMGSIDKLETLSKVGYDELMDCFEYREEVLVTTDLDATRLEAVRSFLTFYIKELNDPGSVEFMCSDTLGEECSLGIVVDYKYYKSLCEMFGSSDRTSHEVALQLLSNIDVREYPYFILSIFHKYSEVIKASKTSNTVSIKSFLTTIGDYYRLHANVYVQHVNVSDKILDIFQTLTTNLNKKGMSVGIDHTLLKMVTAETITKACSRDGKIEVTKSTVDIATGEITLSVKSDLICNLFNNIKNIENES